MAEKRKNDEATPKKKKEARCNQLSPREKEKLFNQYIMPRLDSIKSLTRRYTDHYQYVDDNYALDSSNAAQNIIRVTLNYRGTVTLSFIYSGRNTYAVKYCSTLKFHLTVVYSE